MISWRLTSLISSVVKTFLARTCLENRTGACMMFLELVVTAFSNTRYKVLLGSEKVALPLIRTLLQFCGGGSLTFFRVSTKLHGDVPFAFKDFLMTTEANSMPPGACMV